MGKLKAAALSLSQQLGSAWLATSAVASATATAVITITSSPDRGAFQFVGSVIAGFGALIWALAYRRGLTRAARLSAVLAGTSLVSAVLLLLGRVPEVVAVPALLVALLLSSAGLPLLGRTWTTSRHVGDS